MAYNYINQDDWYIAPNEAGPKARDAARKALALDENDADAVLALAITTQWYEWDWIAADRLFTRAIELICAAKMNSKQNAWTVMATVRHRMESDA